MPLRHMQYKAGSIMQHSEWIYHSEPLRMTVIKKRPINQIVLFGYTQS